MATERHYEPVLLFGRRHETLRDSELWFNSAEVRLLWSCERIDAPEAARDLQRALHDASEADLRELLERRDPPGIESITPWLERQRNPQR